MSDRDRMLQLLQERGSRGVTTFELRRMGISGNPSQRKAELEARGFDIAAESYSEGRRRGKRYVLISGPIATTSGPQPSEPSVPSAGKDDRGRRPTASDLREGSVDSGGLFDADAYKPRRQHDQEAA